jgi:hypothetical protein
MTFDGQQASKQAGDSIINFIYHYERVLKSPFSYLNAFHPTHESDGGGENVNSSVPRRLHGASLVRRDY